MITHFHLLSHLCSSMTGFHSRARTPQHGVYAPAQLPQNTSVSPAQERFAQWHAILIAQSPRRGRLQSNPDWKHMRYFGPGAWRSSEAKEIKKVQSIWNYVFISLDPSANSQSKLFMFVHNRWGFFFTCRIIWKTDILNSRTMHSYVLTKMLKAR